MPSDISPATLWTPTNLAQILGDFRSAVLSYNPYAYWRHGEASGTVMKDETRLHHGVYTTAPTLAVAGMIVGDRATCATYAAASSQYATPPNYVDPGGDVTILALVSKAAAGLALIIDFAGDNTWLGMDAGGLAKFTVPVNKGATGANIADGNPHLVVGTLSGTNVTCGVDGVLGTPVTGAAAHAAAAWSGVGTYIGKHSGGYYWNGRISDVAIITGLALTAAQQLELWKIARAL